MTLPTGYLADHPVPSGIVGALSLNGYQLLVDVAGVGSGRLGPQVFLLVADLSDATPVPHVSLHQPRLRDEQEASAFNQLAAQLGFLRLSGYRLALERAGLRTRVSVVNPATGAIVLTIPEKHPARLFASRTGVSALLTAARGLPPAGTPPDLKNPEALRQMLLSLALRDEAVGGAEAADLADRALELIRADDRLDPARALEAARNG